MTSRTIQSFNYATALSNYYCAIHLKNRHLFKMSKDKIQHSMDTKMLSLGYSTNENFPLSLLLTQS